VEWTKGATTEQPGDKLFEIGKGGIGRIDIRTEIKSRGDR